MVKLLRGEITPDDLPALDVVKRDRKLWCLSNRRLTDLKLFQATQQDQTVYAKCVLRFPDQKFQSSFTSGRDGLAIRPRTNSDASPATPIHFGADLNSQAAQTISGLRRLPLKHPAKVDHSFSRTLVLRKSSSGSQLANSFKESTRSATFRLQE
jgi:hypothetical protein